jgi:hypothetical protein
MVRATATKQSDVRETRWNFGDTGQVAPVSLEEFLAKQDASKFFAGKEPWMDGLLQLSWHTFFRVCTEEMDDLSEKAVKLVIEYCLGILEEAERKIPGGKPTLARLEAALNLNYAEQYENQAFQYRWALRHPVVKEAVTKALSNRFPSR